MTTAAVEYHPLTVASLEPLTDDSVAITFDVPQDLQKPFQYKAGQHIAIRTQIEGEDVTRTYSICEDASDGRLRIGVKQLEGGRFSTYAATRLRIGDSLDVAAPHGEFTITTDSANVKHYGAIAAGSGITPVLSMIKTVMAAEPHSRFTLVFGNRASASIMFLEELEGLKDRYPARLHLVHVLSREAQIIPALSGRLDAARLSKLFGAVIDVGSVDSWYLCGPYEMVEAARSSLSAHGVDDAVINDELFFAEPAPPPPPAPPVDLEGLAQVTFTLDGRTSSIAVDPAGEPILAYALQERRDTPFSCRGGMCTTCKAKVTSGKASMDINFALAEEDIEKGYILTCQAHPVSDELAITYDV